MENQAITASTAERVTNDDASDISGAVYNVTRSVRQDIDPERVRGWWEERAARYQAPEIWNIGHVDYRMVGAFRVLLRLPIQTRPREFGNAMPQYLYEWSDFLAQAEGDRELRRAGNRLIYRHKGATADEVAEMEQALAWPMTYLGKDAEAAQAVLLGSMWKAMEADIERRSARLGIGRRSFFYRRKRGLGVIVKGLISDRVVVT